MIMKVAIACIVLVAMLAAAVNGGALYPRCGGKLLSATVSDGETKALTTIANKHSKLKITCIAMEFRKLVVDSCPADETSSSLHLRVFLRANWTDEDGNDKTMEWNLHEIIGGSVQSLVVSTSTPAVFKLMVTNGNGTCQKNVRALLQHESLKQVTDEKQDLIPAITNVYPVTFSTRKDEDAYFQLKFLGEPSDNDKLTFVEAHRSCHRYGAKGHKAVKTTHLEFAHASGKGSADETGNRHRSWWKQMFGDAGNYRVCYKYNTLPYEEIGTVTVFGGNPAYFEVVSGNGGEGKIFINRPTTFRFFGENLDTTKNGDAVKFVDDSTNCDMGKPAGGAGSSHNLGPRDETGVSTSEWTFTLRTGGTFRVCYKLKGGRKWHEVVSVDDLPPTERPTTPIPIGQLPIPTNPHTHKTCDLAPPRHHNPNVPTYLVLKVSQVPLPSSFKEDLADLLCVKPEVVDIIYTYTELTQTRVTLDLVCNSIDIHEPCNERDRKNMLLHLNHVRHSALRDELRVIDVSEVAVSGVLAFSPTDNEDFEAYTCTDTTCSNCTLVKKSLEAVVNGDCISMNGKSAKRLCRDGKYITDSFDNEDCSGGPVSHFSVTAGKCLVGDGGHESSSIVFCPANAAKSPNPPTHTVTSPPHKEPSASPIAPPIDSESFVSYDCYDTTCTNCTLAKGPDIPIRNGECASHPGEGYSVILTCDPKTQEISFKGYKKADCSGSPDSEDSFKGNKCYVSGGMGRIIFCPTTALNSSSSSPAPSPPSPTRITPPENSNYFVVYKCHDSTCTNCTLTTADVHIRNGECVSEDDEFTRATCDAENSNIRVDSFMNDGCTGAPVSHQSFTSGKCYGIGTNSMIIFCPTTSSSSANVPNNTLPAPMSPPQAHDEIRTYNCHDTTCTNCSLRKQHWVFDENGCAQTGDSSSMQRVCYSDGQILTMEYTTSDCTGRPTDEFNYTSGKCNRHVRKHVSSIIFCPSKQKASHNPASTHEPRPAATPIPAPVGNKHVVGYICEDTTCSDCSDMVKKYPTLTKNGDCTTLNGREGGSMKTVCDRARTNITVTTYASNDCRGESYRTKYIQAAHCTLVGGVAGIMFCPDDHVGQNSDPPVESPKTLPSSRAPTSAPPATAIPPPVGNKNVVVKVCKDRTCSDCTDMVTAYNATINGDCISVFAKRVRGSYKFSCNRAGTNVTVRVFGNEKGCGGPRTTVYMTPGQCRPADHEATSAIVFCPDVAPDDDDTNGAPTTPPSTAPTHTPAAAVPPPVGNKNVIIKECKDTRCSDCEDFFSAYNATVNGDCATVPALKSSFRAACNAARTNVSVRVFENSDCSGKARDSVYFKSGQCQRGGAEGSDGSTIVFCPSPPPTAHPAATRIPGPVGNKHVVGYICQDTTCSDCSDMDKKLDPTATRNGDCMTSNGGSYRAVCNPAHTNITITTYVEGDCSGEVIRTDYVTPNRCEVEDGTMSGIMFCPDRTASELHPSPSSHSPHTRVPHTSTPPPSHSPKTPVPPVSIVGGDETATKQPASSQTSSAHPSATMKPHHSPSNHPTKARKDEPQTKKGDSHPLLIAFSVVVVLGVASIAAFLLVQKRTAATRRRMALVPMEEEEDYTTGDDDLDDLIGVPAEDKKNSKAPRRSPLNEEMAEGLAIGGTPPLPLNAGDDEDLENSIEV